MYSTIFGFKITIVSQKWSIRGANLIKDVKRSDFDPKRSTIFFEIIFILTAAKDYTGNFSDTPFGPDYWTSSNAYPTTLSNQTYFQCILKIV